MLLFSVIRPLPFQTSTSEPELTDQSPGPAPPSTPNSAEPQPLSVSRWNVSLTRVAVASDVTVTGLLNEL